MDWTLFIQILILATVVPGAILLVFYILLIRSVDGAKQRLDHDAEIARAREAELNQKIKEADAELQQRKKELDILERKMRADLEEQANKHKDELVQKARKEAEDIITKAQNAREAIRREIEKEAELKTVDHAVRILSEVLTAPSKEALDKQLGEEFIEKLKKVDMARLGPDVKSADVVTATPLDPVILKGLSDIFKERLGREIKFNPRTDKSVVGGVVLQFGSLLLDGSLQHAFKEAAVTSKQQVERQST